MEMPIRNLRKLLELMPQLEAEESLTAVQRAAVGSGMMKPEASREILDSWRGRLTGQTVLRKPVSSPNAMLAFAQMAGAKVVPASKDKVTA